MRALVSLWFLGVGLVAGLVPFACDQPDYAPVPFRCAPSGPGPACPDGYLCCSDDPATLTGDLPGYAGRGAGAVPLFSGINNALSSMGMCVEDGLLAPGAGLTDPGAQGCPVPCNPGWEREEVEAVCGPQTLCCQTVELGPRDCVLDDDCWRPATGLDIFAQDVEGSWGTGPDPWKATTHDTHQDPGGDGCRAFAQGDPDAEQDCFRRLSVADQRGLCMALSPTVQFCPLTDPAYLDACEHRNVQEGRACG